MILKKESSESRAEQKRKVAESDQQIRRCRDRRKLGQVCSVPADGHDSLAFAVSCLLLVLSCWSSDFSRHPLYAAIRVAGLSLKFI